MSFAYELVCHDRDRWKARAEQAEAIAMQALRMAPLGGSTPETAQQFADRIRSYVERCHPGFIIRTEHTRIKVLQLAETCGCDPDADDWEQWHSESDENGEWLCDRKHLGYICDTCVREDEGGPDWSPDRHEWPCPPIAALDANPAA